MLAPLAVPLTASQDAFVRVAVASVWRSPAAARPVDAPALAVPADIRRWLAAMTLAQKRELVGRLDTQVLLGDRVLVVERRADWARIAVPAQATPLDARGYPGWLPAAQLTDERPPPSALEATVVVPTAWLVDPLGGRRVMEVSMGTRLPVLEKAPSSVVVAVPGGGSTRIASTDVSVTAAGEPARGAAAADIVSAARQLEGLPYLWAGTSGFGFDCSGLTYLDYRIHGITIPRDADAQANAGTPVAEGDLQPGDLLFYARSGAVHHVAMAVAPGLMVQSPQTGRPVEVVSVSSRAEAADFRTARRYLR